MLSKINFLSFKQFPHSIKFQTFPIRYFSQSKRDFYKILGVSKTASDADIKKAFYQLAKQHHPDLVKGSEDKFKEINEAYEVLSDGLKRREYDNSSSYSGSEGGASKAQYGTKTTYHYGYGAKGRNGERSGTYQETKYYYTSDKGTDAIKNRWYQEYMKAQNQEVIFLFVKRK